MPRRYFIYLNWMPSYFHHVFGMDVKSSSLFSFLPWTVRPALVHHACSNSRTGHMQAVCRTFSDLTEAAQRLATR